MKDYYNMLFKEIQNIITNKKENRKSTKKIKNPKRTKRKTNN